MEKQGPNVWLVGFIIVAAFYLTLLLVVVSLSLLSITVTTLPYWVLGFSILFLGYAIYVGLAKNRTLYLSIGLTVAGVVFIVLGAFLFVPYTTSQTYSTGTSYDLTNGIFLSNTNSRPFIDQNGTLIENTLSPLSSRTFDYWWGFGSNSSVYQFAYSGSDDADFAILYHTYDGSDTVFNETFFTTQAGFEWDFRFWTNPSTHFHTRDTWELIFTNRQNQTLSFYFRMTEFDYPVNIAASNTNYRSFMDSRLAYTGLFMMCVAVGIGGYLSRRSRIAAKIDGSEL
jgi:hypothetical protein